MRKATAFNAFFVSTKMSLIPVSQTVCFALVITLTLSLYSIEGQKATIMFGGDISFSGIIRLKVDSGKCTYNGSFDKILKYFKEADEVVVNLENIVVGNGEIEEVKSSGAANKVVTLMSEEKSLLALK